MVYSSALEQREYEAVCHVKESMQIAESALLEKEQAVIREQQLSKEVERQKLVMATILKEAGERTRREVWQGGWCAWWRGGWEPGGPDPSPV